MTPSEIQAIEFAAYIGIGWADQKHDLCLQEAGSKQIESLRLDPLPDSISNWGSELRQRFPGQPIALAVAQQRGALLYSLLHDEFIVLSPVNPPALASSREAFPTSGAKDDPVDAGWLPELVRWHPNNLRPWIPDDPWTRELWLRVEPRRRWVDDRTRLTHRLQAWLKPYFPQALDWAGELDTVRALDFLAPWPPLAALPLAPPEQLRDFSQQQQYRLGANLPARLAEISGAQPLTLAKAVLTAASTMVQTRLEPRRGLLAGIEPFDQPIKDCSQQHPDQESFNSFPGAGAVLAPRW